jgi:hypothetical protein
MFRNGPPKNPWGKSEQKTKIQISPNRSPFQDFQLWHLFPNQKGVMKIAVRGNEIP